MNASTALKKLARRLLTTTCLTAAAIGAAQGSTFTESTDFNGTFAGANLLPVGTDQVIGTTTDSDTDFFKFTGLTPGASYSFSGSYSFFELQVGVLNSSQAYLNPLSQAPATFGGTVPSDGMLVLQVGGVCGDCGSQDYDLTLTQTGGTGIPEPSTAATAALGLAAAAAFGARRRRSK